MDCHVYFHEFGTILLLQGINKFHFCICMTEWIDHEYATKFIGDALTANQFVVFVQNNWLKLLFFLLLLLSDDRICCILHVLHINVGAVIGFVLVFLSNQVFECVYFLHFFPSYVSLSRLAPAAANTLFLLCLWPFYGAFNIVHLTESLFLSRSLSFSLTLSRALSFSFPLGTAYYLTYLVLFTIHKAQINYTFVVDECIFRVRNMCGKTCWTDILAVFFFRSLFYAFNAFHFSECVCVSLSFFSLSFFRWIFSLPIFQLTPSVWGH